MLFCRPRKNAIDPDEVVKEVFILYINILFHNVLCMFLAH